MKEVLMMIAVVLGVIALIVGAFALSGLIYWGIGAFIIWAFAINFAWTFWQGLAIAFIVNILSEIFKITVKKED